MIRLVAENRSQVLTDLDVPETTIELNFQIEDLRKPGARTAPFSLTFKLPFTATNNAFFTGVEQPSFSRGDFDINKRTDATIYDGSVRLMKGMLQVTSIDLQLSKFNCRFYSAQVDFFQAIRGKRWRDVWTDLLGNLDCPLDHTLNGANVYNCWQGLNPTDIDPSVPAGTIHYPLTDNGGHPAGDGQQPAALIDAWENGISPLNLHPAVKVSYLMDEICRYAGYTRLTDFWDDADVNNDNLYVLAGLQSRIVDSRASYGWFVTGQVDTTSPGQQLEFWQIVNFNSVDPPNYDPDDMWAESTAYFKLPLSGVYFIEVTLSTQDSVNGQYNSQFIVEGSNGNAGATYSFAAGSIDTDPITFTLDIVNTNVNEPYFPMIYTAADARIDVTMQYVNFQPIGGQDAVLDMATVMGEEPLDKWVKGLVETFNLVIKIDEDDKTIEFEPYDQFHSLNQDALDWTDRLDMSGTQELLPASEYQQARLTLTPAEAEDHRNVYYQNVFGVRKGQYVRVSDGDFTEGEVTLNDFFGLLRLTYLKWFVNPYTGQAVQTGSGISTEIIISELWNSAARLETTYEKLPPMLCYYQGTQPNNSTYPVLLANFATEPTTLPLFTTYTFDASGTPRISLEYAVSAPDLNNTAVIGNPTQGLLEAYWYRYIEEIYSPAARVYNCQMRLTPSDIQSLDFSKPINVLNIKYRLIGISNYIVGSDGLCNVKLFRTEQTTSVVRCTLRPEIGRNGIVIWYDEDGDIVVGNALCCQQYGWIWNPDRNACEAFSRRTTDQTPRVFDDPSIATYGTTMAVNSDVLNYDNYLGGPVTDERWQMTCTTTSGSAVVAETLNIAQTLFLVGREKSVNIIIDWVCVQTSGSNIGSSSSGEESILLNTISGTTSKSAGSIYSRGAGGVGVDVVSSDGTDGSKWNVQCSGLNNTNIQWFLDVRCVTYDATTLTRPAIPSYAIFQDNDIYLFQNDDEMEWNA
jgi:hypothetical protein